MAQESHHGHFPFSHALERHAREAREARDAQEAENAAAEELEARLAEAEDSSVSLTLLGAEAEQLGDHEWWLSSLQ